MCVGCVREAFSDLQAIFFDISVGIFLGSFSDLVGEQTATGSCCSSTPSVKPGPEMAAQGHTVLSQDALVLSPRTPPWEAGFTHCCQCL